MDLKDTPYYQQTDLLLQVLPIIAKIDDFALKGGTAINLFIRDLPAVQWKMMNLKSMNSKNIKLPAKNWIKVSGVWDIS